MISAQKEIKKKDKELKQRKVIERAKGIIMNDRKISEKEAYEYMRKISMDKRLTMIKVANMIIASDEINKK